MSSTQANERNDWTKDEEEGFVDALRKRVAGKSGVQVEAETGISQSRLSRHIKETGLSAKLLLLLHDRTQQFVDAAKAFWQRCAGTLQKMEAFLAAAEGVLQEVRSARARAMEEAKQVLGPYVDEAKRCRDRIVGATDAAISEGKRQLEPMIARIQRDVEKVEAAKDDAVHRFNQAVAPAVADVTKKRDEVAAAKEEAATKIREVCHAELEDLKRSREAFWSTRDAAVAKVSKEADDGVARLRSVVKSEVEAAKANVSAGMNTALESARTEAGRTKAIREPLEKEAAVIKMRAGETLATAKDYADSAIVHVNDRLDVAGDRLDALESRTQQLSVLGDSLLTTNRRSMENLQAVQNQLASAKKELEDARQVLTQQTLQAEQMLQAFGSVALSLAEVKDGVLRRMEDEKERAETNALAKNAIE